MISNQYQNQTNFQGNLLKTGIKLPQKKFNEVAKIFSERTFGKPDLTLLGRREQNEQGRFYHSIDAVINGNDVTSIPTKSFKSMFEYLSPKKIAEELINLSRKFDSKDKAYLLKKEINDAQKRLIGIKFQLEHISKPDVVKRLQTIISRMEASIAQKEKQYARIKPADISGEWC